MRYSHSRHSRRRSRFLSLLSMFALLMMLAGPLASTGARAGNDQPATDDVTDEQATEVPPDAAPTEAPDDIIVTEVPTEIPAVAESATLTISVYRCDHPEYDTGFSENIQTVLDTCTGPGYGAFSIETGIPSSTQSGQAVQFEIDGFVTIMESVPSGYDNPIANCFIYDAGGNLVDQIGPGEASGGGWKVGGIADGDVHCDWYQVDRGVGNVYIVNMACPSTARMFPKPTMDELIQQCIEPAGQRHFIVEHGPGLERQGVTGGEFNDTFIEAVKTGAIAIRLTDPAGFDSARVFCQVFGTDQITQVAPFSEVAVSNFRASGLTLVNGQRIHCSWFNILEGPGFALPDDDLPELATETPGQQTSDLVIVKHTCPEGYDPETDDADPMTDCPEGPDGVTFSIASVADPDDAAQDVTGTSAPNRASFNTLTPGDYLITEAIPGGVAVVFVLGCGGGGVDPVPTFVTGPFQVGIPQGVVLTCHWFNIAEGTQDVDEASTNETGRIVFQTFVCPDDQADPSLGAEAVADACSERMEGVEFSATGSNGATQTGTSNTTGTVTFDDFPAGEATH